MREPTFFCKQCWDTGILIVVHPDSMKEARREREEFIESGKARTAAVRCDACRKAAAMSPNIPMLDARMVLWPYELDNLKDKEQRAAVVEVCYEHVMASSDWEAAQEFT